MKAAGVLLVVVRDVLPVLAGAPRHHQIMVMLGRLEEVVLRMALWLESVEIAGVQHAAPTLDHGCSGVCLAPDTVVRPRCYRTAATISFPLVEISLNGSFLPISAKRGPLGLCCGRSWPGVAPVRGRRWC